MTETEVMLSAGTAASKPFSFIVGAGAREFTIHSAIVAGLSSPLSKLVNGAFLESAAGKVNWRHVDEGTFMYFWQYAYTGNYQFNVERVSPESNADNLPQPFSFGRALATTAKDVPAFGGGSAKSDTSDAGSTTEDDAEVFSKFHPYYRKSAKKKKRKSTSPTKQELLWWRFTRLVIPVYLAPSPPSNVSDAQGTVDGCLLSHAKVYALADCYDIIKLRNLSYNKLHGCLMHMYANSSSLAQFVVLVQFCYESPVPDSLKQLVVHFATCDVERLWEDKEFQDVLEVYGDLSKGIIGSLRSRLE